MAQGTRETPGRQDGALKLSAIREALSLACLAPPPEDHAVEAGFASDVLSEVLSRAPRGCLLVTAQSSMNVVAVAAHARIAGVIITTGHTPAGEVVARAREEGVAIYATACETFEVVARLGLLGLNGSRRRRRHGGHRDEAVHG